ncbi:MAG TPA: extracellular solute-binding protein, partial [Limnochordia bacterium]|nr:extracellular solute-binding protein [Limnochordia bacterium]
TWYASGIEPDVMQVGAQYVGLLAPQGLILPLDPFVKDWPDLADFPKAVVGDATYNGHIFDVPYRLDQRGFFYRKDLFAQSGLDPTAPPTTWDALASTAKKLTIMAENGKFKQSGMSINNADQLYALFLLQAGGHYISEDLHHVLINSPEAIQAMQFESDLVNQYHVSPPNGFGSITSTSSPSAMSYGGVGAIIDPPEGTEIASALPPAGPGGRAGGIWINKWVVGAQTKDAKLAWDWIKSISAPGTMAQLAALSGHMPPRFSMLKYSPWADDPNWRPVYDTAGITPPFRAQVPVTNDFIHSGNQPFTQAIDDVLHNKKSPSVAFGEVQQFEQAKLDEFWKNLAR